MFAAIATKKDGSFEILCADFKRPTKQNILDQLEEKHDVTCIVHLRRNKDAKDCVVSYKMDKETCEDTGIESIEIKEFIQK
jgi:hypothetical protein